MHLHGRRHEGVAAHARHRARVLGARLAHALSKRRLEIAFALFLLAASLRFLLSLLG